MEMSYVIFVYFACDFECPRLLLVDLRSLELV
jgi:hypothetical protein